MNLDDTMQNRKFESAYLQEAPKLYTIEKRESLQFKLKK